MGVQDPHQSADSGLYGYGVSTYHSSAQNVYSFDPYQQAASYPMPAASSSKIRKLPGSSPRAAIDLTQDSPPKKQKTQRKGKTAEKSDLFDVEVGEGKPKKKAKKPKDEERRLKRWRKHAPTSYLEVRDRALTQRMFVLDRQRDSTGDHPTETVSLAGTTGNIYTITIDKVPSCDCPHAKKGNQCKHIAYVMKRVLRAPAHLECQLALISSELREIFEKAPPLPSETAAESEEDGKRKPVEGECPICSEDFDVASGESIVYCKAACGNNIHAACFKQWAATKTPVTCPFCRTPWESNDGEAAAKDVARDGPRNADGYVNVASQLGLSGRRDYSNYHSYWVRNQAMRGNLAWDEDGVMMHDY